MDVEQNRQDAHRPSHYGEAADKPAGLCLQPWRRYLQRAERAPDLADFALCAGREYLAYSRSAHDHRTGKHIGQIIAPRPACSRRSAAPAGDFPHRHGLTGQQRLIGL